MFRSAVIAVALLACSASFAGTKDAQQRGTLTAGLRYVVPAYQSGAKFRTPAMPDNALLEDIAKRLGLPLSAVRADAGSEDRLLAEGKADIVLAPVALVSPLRRNYTVIPIGYVAAPMAIMRTDTDIKSWDQLRGRKVCVAEGGLYAGMLATRYGAVEMLYKAPADALIAVRTGDCDATVHDAAMLEELIKYPEWQKFSARLPAGPGTPLAFVVPSKDRASATFLKQVVRDWSGNGVIDKLMKKSVRDIAFEVYLDQAVPDCH